jgi:hypothetical protein
MAEKLLAAVTSDAQPQPGQKHRSSGNFSTQDAPVGTNALRWEIADTGNPNGIRFGVKDDKSVGVDPPVFEDVYNNKQTGYVADRSLYVANPEGASSKFTVKVYAIY